MGIAVTDDHRELGAVVRAFLARHEARGAARTVLDAAEEKVPGFWPEIAALGWLGVHVGAAYGGADCGLPELVVIVEEFGRAVAPGPFVPTVIASAVLGACGDDAVRARRLPGLVDGSVTAAVGFGGGVVVDADGRATGESGVVLGAGTADLLLLCAGEDVLVLPRDGEGVTVTVPDNLDPTRRSGRVRLDGAAGDLLPGACGTALALARTILAAEAVGGASDCLETAVAYAGIRKQFGRTIATFQAVKHHCANMLVAAESAVATVWDAARAAGEDARQFELVAAAAATLALSAYVHNAELDIQVHGGVGFTWDNDAHLHLRRALTLRALHGGDEPAADVFRLTSAGVTRATSLDFPSGTEELRSRIRGEAERLARTDEDARLDDMIASGYVMPHWPRPWGRAAGAVEQLLIEEEFARAGVRRPDYSITGWVVLTLIEHGTPWQIERFVEKALRREEVWCQLFSEPDAGSDAAAITTRATRVEGGWTINGQKVWTSGAHYSRRGLATVRTNPDVPKHAGITTVVIDMQAPGVRVRPLRMLIGGSEFNEVFFDDVFVPDEDVVGAPDAGWAVARATLGNERVSLGGGSPGMFPASTLVSMAAKHPDRLAGAEVRVGRFLAEDHALRLLDLRRAVRHIEGAGPGPEGNLTKLKLAEHVNERAAIMAALTGPDLALAEGEAAVTGLVVLGSRALAIAGGTSEVTRNQIAERILGMPRDPLVD